MASRSHGREADRVEAIDVAAGIPAGGLLFHEKRSTITVSRRNGIARPPLVLDESGCRVSGIASGHPFATVLDEPGPRSLRRIAGLLSEGLAEPAAIGDATTRERASRFIEPIAALFARWSSELSMADLPAGCEIIDTKMDATIVLSRIAVARARGDDPFLVARDLRASVEGRLSITLRHGDRPLTVEATRWADALADPPAAAFPGWHGAAAEALQRGADLLDAVPPPAMTAPAVFSPGAAGILLHETCAHLLEGDLVASGASPFARLAGEKVAIDHLTLVDDPRLERARVRLLVDDEGNETRATVLIEAGVLRGFLTDGATAAALAGAAAGTASTANARRESYRFAAIPRMTNILVAAGEEAPADLMKPISRGLYVERLGRGQVDPRRGEFRLEVESGRLIESGRPGRSISGAFLVGSCRELLRAIDGIGDDVRIDSGAGACIKEDQIVPVGQATPSIRVAKVRVLPGVAQ